jgi:hypothetical protein
MLLNPSRHLLDQPVSHGIVGVLDGGAVVVLYLHEAVQVVVSVLGGGGQPWCDEKKTKKDYTDDLFYNLFNHHNFSS